MSSSCAKSFARTMFFIFGVIYMVLLGWSVYLYFYTGNELTKKFDFAKKSGVFVDHKKIAPILVEELQQNLEEILKYNNQLGITIAAAIGVGFFTILSGCFFTSFIHSAEKPENADGEDIA